MSEELLEARFDDSNPSICWIEEGCACNWYHFQKTHPWKVSSKTGDAKETAMCKQGFSRSNQLNSDTPPPYSCDVPDALS